MEENDFDFEAVDMDTPMNISIVSFLIRTTSTQEIFFKLYLAVLKFLVSLG